MLFRKLIPTTYQCIGFFYRFGSKINISKYSTPINQTSLLSCWQSEIGSSKYSKSSTIRCIVRYFFLLKQCLKSLHTYRMTEPISSRVSIRKISHYNFKQMHNRMVDNRKLQRSQRTQNRMKNKW